METYRTGAYFGKYRILSTEADFDKARIDVVKKWNTYKDGSTKKEHIRPYIERNDIFICRDI